MDSAKLRHHPVRAAQGCGYTTDSGSCHCPKAQTHLPFGTSQSGAKLLNGSDGDTPTPVTYTQPPIRQF